MLGVEWHVCILILELEFQSIRCFFFGTNRALDASDKNFRAFDGSATRRFCIKISQLGFQKEMLQLDGQSKQQMRMTEWGTAIY